MILILGILFRNDLKINILRIKRIKIVKNNNNILMMIYKKSSNYNFFLKFDIKRKRFVNKKEKK